MSVVETYINANADFETAKAELEKLISSLTDIASALQLVPDGVFFSETKPSIPPDIAMRSLSKCIDRGQLPSHETIQKSLIRRHATKKLVKKAWADVPPSMRQSLIPPKL